MRSEDSAPAHKSKVLRLQKHVNGSARSEAGKCTAVWEAVRNKKEIQYEVPSAAEVDGAFRHDARADVQAGGRTNCCTNGTKTESVTRTCWWTAPPLFDVFVLPNCTNMVSGAAKVRQQQVADAEFQQLGRAEEAKEANADRRREQLMLNGDGLHRQQQRN